MQVLIFIFSTIVCYTSLSAVSHLQSSAEVMHEKLFRAMYGKKFSELPSEDDRFLAILDTAPQRYFSLTQDSARTFISSRDFQRDTVDVQRFFRWGVINTVNYFECTNLPPHCQSRYAIPFLVYAKAVYVLSCKQHPPDARVAKSKEGFDQFICECDDIKRNLLLLKTLDCIGLEPVLTPDPFSFNTWFTLVGQRKLPINIPINFTYAAPNRFTAFLNSTNDLKFFVLGEIMGNAFLGDKSLSYQATINTFAKAFILKMTKEKISEKAQLKKLRPNLDPQLVSGGLCFHLTYSGFCEPNGGPWGNPSFQTPEGTTLLSMLFKPRQGNLEDAQYSFEQMFSHHSPTKLLSSAKSLWEVCQEWLPPQSLQVFKYCQEMDSPANQSQIFINQFKLVFQSMLRWVVQHLPNDPDMPALEKKLLNKYFPVLDHYGKCFALQSKNSLPCLIFASRSKITQLLFPRIDAIKTPEDLLVLKSSLLAFENHLGGRYLTTDSIDLHGIWNCLAHQ